MPISAHFEDIEGIEGQPRAVRRRLQFEVQGALESGHATQVQVHNLSETGLLLETADTLEIGEAIDLDLPEPGSARARVAWASGTLYGCAFDTPLSTAELSAVQLRSGAQTGAAIGPSPAPAGPAAIG
ncbi:MAG: PilZ domain-containing protein, partial [Novosphingobium sp.]